MNKAEFECEVNKLSGDSTFSVTDKTFGMITHVYTFHPSISETNGKAQIAYLFYNFGMRIIKDMYPTATKMAELEEEKAEAVRNLNNINDKINKFKYGGDIE